jgi:hypothetical protein
MDQRMRSIAPECNEAKHKYDDCFQNWFTTKYLTNRHNNVDPCSQLLKDYQLCTKLALHEQGIDLEEIDARVLNTDKDKSSTKDEKQ